MGRDFQRASRNRWSMISVLVGAVLLQAGLAQARSAGIASSSFTPMLGDGCHNCHNVTPGTAPLVMLSVDDVTVAAGQQITLTFVVTSQAPAQTHSGFNIRSDKPGIFAIGVGPTSANTRTIAGAMGWLEATHSAPRPNVANVATFTVLWTPLATTSGTVMFTAWGNSVNNNGNNMGDRAATTSLPVTVASGCVPVAETCNGLDDDCDGVADDGLPTTQFFLDLDGDGVGAAASGMKQACSLAQAGAGYVATGGDCNDAQAAIHPGATEICNAMDDDCDLVVDDGLPTTTFYRDADGDGYGAVAGPTMTSCSATVAGYATSNTDCDDTSAAIHPGTAEICNGKDDNCNAATDEGLPPLTCGAAPCTTTVPACVAGVPQTCTPICPPEPDAATDIASDSALVEDAAPVDVVSDGPGPDQNQAVTDGASADTSSAPATDASVDATPDGFSPPIVGIIDAAASPGATIDAATRPPLVDGRTDTGVAPPASGGGCSCRVGAGQSGENAFPIVLVTLLVGVVVRRLASSRRRRAAIS
jgi:hypothetical protein